MSKALIYMDEISKVIDGTFVPPICAEIDPTNACQNECDFCIFPDRDRGMEISLESYRSIIHQLKELGCLAVTFSGGGEPTCHAGFNEMVEYAVDAGFKIGLITNGILLHTVDVGEFAFVRISLDAGTAEEYERLKGLDAFAQVVANVRKARKNAPLMGLHYVVTDQSLDDRMAAQTLADDLAVDYIQFKPVHHAPIGQFESYSERTIYYDHDPEITNAGCRLSVLTCVISADMRYVYCNYRDRYSGDRSVANLHETPLSVAIKQRGKPRADATKCAGFRCRYCKLYEDYLKYNKAGYGFLRNKEFI